MPNDPTELPATSCSDAFRTSRRIKYATDKWGNADETHLEVDWNGDTLFIDITDDRIHIIGSKQIAVDIRACNSLEIKPVSRQNAQNQGPRNEDSRS